MSGPLHTVHVRVNDAATGQPTPVRIRFVGKDRKYYAPFGRLASTPFRVKDAEHAGGNIQLCSVPWAYIDGTCEIRLPAYPITVEICKGFEYTPISREVTLGQGKLALRFVIQRWADLGQLGWYAGDTSVFHYSPHSVLLEAAGEGLAVANLLACERWQSEKEEEIYVGSIPNIVAFSGQASALEMPGCQVVVNTKNSGQVLGNLCLLNCHRPVYPLSTTGLHYDLAGPYDWTLADWCDQCHRKGGLVLWAYFGPWQFRASPNDGFGGETLADLILGRIDAVDISELHWAQRLSKDEWYRILNCNFRVPFTGGSGKFAVFQAVGSLRTYARLRDGEQFTYKNWIEAIRAGRTFVSNGPLLTLTVNGQDPGAVIDLPESTRAVRVRAEARSIVPFERLELVFNGEPLAGTEASGSPCSALLEGDVEVPGSGWLAARCWGNSPAFAAWDPDSQHAAAHTSPVYLQIAGRPFTPDLMSLALLIERIDKMIAWAEKEARFDSDKRRDQLLGIFQAARAELVRRSQ